MAAKRALVVDDSRSARAFLTRILERYALEVDGASSAEEALEYLTRQRPDVIFMDHLMPGMDGFQALSAIKTDPRTATIPIMMYTSQEGELYLSQARALGAMGVLPKQTRPADVSRALEQLHLLGEGRAHGDTATMPMPVITDGERRRAHDYYEYGGNVRAGALAGPAGELTGEQALAAARAAAPEAPAGPGPLTPEAQALIESMLRDHALEMRRVVAQSLSKHSAQLVEEVRAALAAQPGAAGGDAAGAVSAVGAERHGRAIFWLTAAGAVVAVAVAALWLRTLNDQEQLGDRVATLRSQLVGALVRARTAPRAQTAARAGADAPGGAAGAPAPEVFVDTVPFGESPLAGARIEHVQAEIERLVAGGFHGVVEIRTYSGRFCLQGTADAVTLANPETSYSRCDQLGNPQDASGPTTAARESVAFANMLAALRSRSGGSFTVQVGAGSAEETVSVYPPITEQLTAGEWNRAAAANNRVELRWRTL